METNQPPGAPLTAAQRQLVQDNLGLVGAFLKRTSAVPSRPLSRCEYDDLFQEGTLGLMRAAVRFDHARGRTFVAFALKHIHGAVSRAMADRFATVRVPVKTVKEAHRRLREQGAWRGHPDKCPIDDTTREAALATTSNLGDEDVLLRAPERRGESEGNGLGDLLRVRYESAVEAVSERIRGLGRGRADRSELIERLVRDRLMIPEETERTPLRQIARDLRSTPGRVLACERQIAEQSAEILERDPVYVRVRELAREVEESLGCPVDDSLRRDLARREAQRFVREVEQLDDGQVEALLLRLIREVFGSHSRPAGILFGFLGGKSRVRVLMETLCVGEFERRRQA